MTPEAEPRLQTLRVSLVADVVSPAELVWRALGQGDGAWPSTLLAPETVARHAVGVFRTARAIDGPFAWVGEQSAATSACAGACKVRGRSGEVWTLRVETSDEVATAVVLCPGDESRAQ